MQAHIEVGATAFGLIVAATGIAGVARRFRVSAPVLLVVAGVVATFVPGVPNYTLNPDLVLLLILPPLLYSAALDSSFVGFRANLRPIAFLSVGLVLATTVVVGYAMHAFLHLPLAAAFTLGAIVAPPDAVASAAIGRELGLPRRALQILGGESLINDATALTAYRVAYAAAVGGTVSLLGPFGTFVGTFVGGVAVGLVIGGLLHLVRQRLTEPVLENCISLVTPFIAYFIAERIHASGVLAVVVAGLYLGHHEGKTTYAVRLQARAIWRMVDFVLESVVFALIGLQLPAVIKGLSDYRTSTIVWSSLLILGLVIIVRIIWVFPFTYGPRWLSRRIREREPSPPWRSVFVVSWAGMRGVVSLAAAFALAENFPQRNLILFLTFAVVFGTLVLQGFSLPWVIRALGVSGDDEYQDRLAEAGAQHRAAGAALARLDEMVAGEDPPPPEDVVERLRTMTESRRNGAWERLGGAAGGGAETPSDAFRRLRLAMIDAEREVFLQMRDAGRIDDEVLRIVAHELDLEEAMLDERSAG